MAWETKKLGEVCKLDKVAHNGKDLPYVGMEDIESNSGKFTGSLEKKNVKSNTFKFHSEHVLYGRLRPYLNKVFVPNFTGQCSTEIFPLLLGNSLLKSFLFYWITSSEVVREIDKTCTGARMPRANFSEVLKFDIPVPPLEEQKRIVEILDEAFAGIDQAIANTEKNLASARELFETYLENVFVEKGEGWANSTLAEVCSEKITDGTHQTPKYFDSGYIFLSSKNVTTRSIDWQNIKYIDEVQHQAMHKRIAPKVGDILLAKNGTTGVAAIVDRDIIFDIYVSLAWLRPSDKITSRFMWHFINSRVAKEQFNKRIKGVGVPNLHLQEIREVVINYPKELEEQNRIVNKLDNVLSQIEILEKSYETKMQLLNELKQSLLQKAFTGELTANMAKDMAEAAE